ncbi:response regulator [Sphingomonas mesophila]|uniref:response regulator n=1 Tax=Sphingomonas mesophila TaxID=2303576 RepID=UPI000E595021|nr:response regulator [Sphingomonas mesophila]
MTRPRLLLIDDEPSLAAFVASAAEMSGFEPIETNRDADFQAAFDSERPAMVVLDLGMPGMDGVELLRFLSARGFDGPVLIISGFDRRVLDSAFRLGEELGLRMRGPIEKPARLDALEALLKDNLPSVVAGTRAP